MSATIGIASWGPLVVGTDVDDALLDTLKTWLPTYLTQYKKERSLAFVPARPRTYANTFEGQEFLDHQLPAIVCTTASLQATAGGPNVPYLGTWQSLISCVVRGKRPAATRYLAAMYGGCVARCLLQQAGGAGGVCNDLHWSSARYEQVPDGTGQGRWLLAAVTQLAVYSDEIVQPWGGPDVPDADVYLDEATVVEVDLDVLGSLITITGDDS